MARSGATVINVGNGFIGEYRDWSGLVAPNGWLLCSGLTIGNATSGGTALANAQANKLFVQLWNNFSNSELAVSGGRGASAQLDFDANKTIVLPDLRGRALVGKDNMGGVPANRITAAGSGIDGTINGRSGGAQIHTLSTAQTPSHIHDNGAGEWSSGGFGWKFGQVAGPFNMSLPNATPIAALSAVSGWTSSTGSGGAHQNTQPTFIVNKIIKYV